MNDLVTHPPAALSAQRARWLGLMGVDVYVRRVRSSLAGAGGAESVAARIVFALPVDAGEGFEGAQGALLRDLVRALGLDSAAVTFDTARQDLPWVCFRAAPDDVADVVLAPALTTLRASASARRALWQSLKPLVRRLRG